MQLPMHFLMEATQRLDSNPSTCLINHHPQSATEWFCWRLHNAYAMLLTSHRPSGRYHIAEIHFRNLALVGMCQPADNQQSNIMTTSDVVKEACSGKIWSPEKTLREARDSHSTTFLEMLQWVFFLFSESDREGSGPICSPHQGTRTGNQMREMVQISRTIWRLRAMRQQSSEKSKIQCRVDASDTGTTPDGTSDTDQIIPLLRGHPSPCFLF